jgi:hypothetical protein
MADVICNTVQEIHNGNIKRTIAIMNVMFSGLANC